MAEREKLLIAVDETETSVRAVRYVARVVGAMEEMNICLLHVYPEPPPDFYKKGKTLQEYREDQERKAQRVFAHAGQLLEEAGIAKERVSTRVSLASGKSISDELLAVRQEGDYGTVVVGKRGVSRAEEFLLGSISNSVAQQSVNFTTWIVGSDD